MSELTRSMVEYLRENPDEAVELDVRDLADMAKRCLDYESHIMLRPAEAPDAAHKWTKNEEGITYWTGTLKGVPLHVPAPDYRPNEDGRFTLMLVGGDD